MREHHADPRRVLEVIGLAVEMLAEGASPRGLLAETVRRMGLEPRLGRSDESTEGYALWTAALAAERAAAPIGPYQEAYHRTSDERSEALRKTARALRADILSVSLFCGALAGALDPDIMAVLVKGDGASMRVALDLAEQRGLHEGGYGPERYEEWPEAKEHVHVWLPYTPTEMGPRETPVALLGPPTHRCPCGRFENEWPRGVYEQEAPRMHAGRDCWDLRCQRERGHAGPHRARWPLHGYGGIEEQIDEWGDVADSPDERAAMDDVARDAAY